MKKSIENYNNNPLHGIAFVVLVWPSDLLAASAIAAGWWYPLLCVMDDTVQANHLLCFVFFFLIIHSHSPIPPVSLVGAL